MADRLTTQILDALGRAALAPEGAPLLARRGIDGLFPSTTGGKAAARRACDAGWLEPAGDESRCKLTESGKAYLLEQASPRQVLEDVARAVESRFDQVNELLSVARDLRSEISGMKALVADVAQRLGTASGPSVLAAAASRVVTDWPGAGDCPLPDLYRRLRETQPTLSIGAFHDLLRSMHADDALYLHPWTGPLYRLPEPALALLVGHEVAYYASLRVPAYETPHAADSASRRPAPVLS